MAITTTVSWDDLREAQERDLDDLRDSYAELETLAEEEHGPDALDRPVPDDLEAIDDDTILQRAAIQQQARLLDQSRGVLEKRINLLGVLEEELGSDPFEITMLSGREVMDVEVALRTDADGNDWDRQTLQLVRNQRTVDAAVVDAPEGVPRVDASPVPSECPNALVNSLYERVERFNSAGEADFQPEGFGSAIRSEASASSGTPPTSSTTSAPSVPTDTDAPERGSDS